MTDRQLAEPQPHELARPLKTLAQLILEDIEAGEKAGASFYKSAGEKLNEAREGHFDKDAEGFWKWADDKFGKSRVQIRLWMGFAAATSDKSFKSLSDYKHRHLGHKHATPVGRVLRDWTSPVDAVAEKARAEARRLAAQEEITRQQERDAEAKLGLRLIDIGFKVLAKELHPDKGGSREAMARLTRVRDRLRANV